MNILITGGLGFIGSTLAIAEVKRGNKVTVVDALLPDYGGNKFNIKQIEEEIEIETGDVRNTKLMEKLVKKKDIVYSLAGTLSHVDSMTDPFTDLEINCVSQLTLLEACRKYNPETKILFAGTRNQYGRAKYLPVDENHPIEPVDVNGINNIAAEWYYRLYHNVHGLCTCSLRLTNVYGPRHQMKHSRQGVLNWFIRQLIDGETVELFGNGSQIRGVEFFSDTYIKGLTLRDSIVKVESQDEATTKAACVATQGLADRKDAQNPVFYRDCTFISNINILRLGDDYGVGCNHQFLRCRFVKTGNDPRVRTVAAMGAFWSTGHRLIDCVFEGGASAEDVDWGKTKPGTRDYTVEWTLTVKTSPGTEVAIADAKGAEVFKGKAGEDGSVLVPLAEYRMGHAGKEALTPHTVSAGGKTVKVTMGRQQIVTLP